MGTWNTVRNILIELEIINLKDINVKYVGRVSSSTATGNANKHLAEQKEEKILKN